MTAGNLPACVVGSSANRINLFSSVEFVKEAHPVFNRVIHIGGEERTEPGFLGENPIPVSIFPNQRVRRTVISKDREVVVTGIVSEKRKNSVVALLPVGAVYLVVCPNFDAVVETVALSGESIDEKLGPLFAIQLVPSGKDLDKKVLKMDGAVGKVNGEDGKLAHRISPHRNFSSLVSQSEMGRSHRSQSERACCWRYSSSARSRSVSRVWRRESMESQSRGVRPGIKRERLLGIESGLARPRQPAATASLSEFPQRRLEIIWTK